MNWLESLNEAGRRIQEATRQPRPAPQSREVVVNSPDVKWRPIDRTAALVIAPASWIHRPDAFNRVEKREQPKKNNMNRTELVRNEETGRTTLPGDPSVIRFGKYDVKVTTNSNGEQEIAWEDAQKVLVAMADDLSGDVRPIFQKAKDARSAVNELLAGLGGDMNNFKDGVTKFLNDIRQTRFAVVTETSQMSQGLREVRQFFLGGDYKEELARLREFVELCERLNRLKESGFLDRIADTMLSLSIR